VSDCATKFSELGCPNDLQCKAVSLSACSSNLRIEIAFAVLAPELAVTAIAIVGLPQSSDHFIVYPAAGALEITSSYRHKAAETLQPVVRNTKSSIVLRVHSQFCSYFDKLIGVRHLPALQSAIHRRC
jgi:hypothetical protein